MSNLKVLIVLLLPLYLCMESCGQKGSRNVAFFKDTRAYELAKAVERGALQKIQELVSQDSTLLIVTNTVSGSNVLTLCLYVEQFESFKKLLELGADPNSINSYDKYSILIDAIKYFGTQFEWREDYRYAELLLEYGADPNYVVEDSFTNERGSYVMASSPLMKASAMNLELVKTLIEYGADPYRKQGAKQLTPFGSAIRATQFEIIYYFIDSLEVDIYQPITVRSKDSIFIQDYIVDKRMLKIIRAEESSVIDTVGNEEKWKLIEYLESKGVDFVNYKYKFYQDK